MVERTIRKLDYIRISFICKVKDVGKALLTQYLYTTVEGKHITFLVQDTLTGNHRLGALQTTESYCSQF